MRKFGNKIKIYRNFPEYSQYKEKIKEIEILCVWSDKKDHDNYILAEEKVKSQQFYMHCDSETMILNNF